MKKTVLVLMRSDQSNWGLNGKFDYLYSAVTRCTDSVTLIEYGFGKVVNNISDYIE